MINEPKVAAQGSSTTKIPKKSAARRTVIGLAVVGVFAQLGWSTLNFSTLPVWVKFELHKGQHLGLILGSFMLTEAIFRPWLGALSDRIGRRPLMLIGSAMGIFTSVATLMADSTLAMVALRALDGISLAAFWPAAFAAIGDAIEEKYRSTAMAVLNGVMMAGIALGFPLGGLANDLSRSHSGAFFFVSGVFLLAFLCGLFMIPRVPHKLEHLERGEGEARPHNVCVVKSIIHLPSDMLALSIVVFAGMGLLMPIVKLYAMEQLGMSETKFGMMLAPVAATLGLLALPFGRLADRLGKLVAVSYGLLICAIAMWLIAIVRSVVVAGIAATVIGIGFAVSFPAWMAVVSQAAPSDRRGQVMGAVGMAQGLGAIIGTAVGPLIYSTDWLSLPRLGVMHRNLPFYLSALLISAGTVMAFTWISRLRAGETSGRVIRITEHRAIVAAALIAGMIISGWIVIRYTRPVVPDRVAWLWIQAVVHGDAERAERFTLPSFERIDGAEKTASEMAAEVFSRWSVEEKAYYTPPSHPRYSDRGRRAEVNVVFHFPDRSKVRRVIVLSKQPSGNWKVAEQHAP